MNWWSIVWRSFLVVIVLNVLWTLAVDDTPVGNWLQKQRQKAWVRQVSLWLLIVIVLFTLFMEFLP